VTFSLQIVTVVNFRIEKQSHTTYLFHLHLYLIQYVSQYSVRKSVSNRRDNVRNKDEPNGRTRQSRKWKRNL